MKKILLPILLWSGLSFGQTGLWMDVSIAKKWGKNQSSGIGIGNRENLGIGFDRIFLDAGHQVRLFDGLQIQASYRFALNEKGDQLVLAGDRLYQRIQLGFKFSILERLFKIVSESITFGNFFSERGLSILSKCIFFFSKIYL